MLKDYAKYMTFSSCPVPMLTGSIGSIKIEDHSSEFLG